MLPFSHVMRCDWGEIWDEICVARRARSCLDWPSSFLVCGLATASISAFRLSASRSCTPPARAHALGCCISSIVSSQARFPATATVTVALMLVDVLSSDYRGVSR